MAEGSDKIIQASDKKTFLEQLRLINLAIIATCLLLFVGAGFQTNNALQTAYQDSHSIHRNAYKFVGWLKSGHADLDSQLLSVNRNEPLSDYLHKPDNEFLPFDLETFHRFLPIAVLKSQKNRFPFITREEIDNFKGTLDEFEQIWNTTAYSLFITGWKLQQAKVDRSPDDTDINSSSLVTALKAQEFLANKDFILGVGRLSSVQWYIADSQWYLVLAGSTTSHQVSQRFGFRLLIPLETTDQNIQTLAIRYLNLPWAPGTFRESFSDLNAISTGLESLNLKQLEMHMATLRASGSGSVEIFNTKLPVDFLCTWGILILFGAQLYYYLHIQQFHSVFGSEKSEPSFPWIACYDSGISRFVYVVSIIILPVVTVIYLLLIQLSEFKNHTYIIFACSSATASLLSAALTWWEMDSV